MGKKEEQINTNKAPAKGEGAKDAEKKNVPKNDKGQPLSEQDIMMYKRYGKGPYNDALNKVEDEIKSLTKKSLSSAASRRQTQDSPPEPCGTSRRTARLKRTPF